MDTDLVIYRSLLSGNFILPRHGNKHPYCVYDAGRNPLYHVSKRVFKVLYPLIKTDRKGRITLNLSKVRQLHGNEILKQEYKKILSLKKHKNETQRV